MSRAEEQRAIRQELLRWTHGELRPQPHEMVLRGVYTTVYVGTDTTGVNFTDVIVLGAIHIWGTNITGRIFTYKGSDASPGNNTLTIVKCEPEELRARAHAKQ